MQRSSPVRLAAALGLRLIAIFIAALLVGVAFTSFPGKFTGWLFYLTPAESIYELFVRAVAAAIAGALIGFACGLALLPFLWSRQRLVVVSRAVSAASALAFFYDLLVALAVLEDHGNWGRLMQAGALLTLTGLFLYGLSNPRIRHFLISRYDFLLNRRTTHAVAAAALVGAAAMWLVSWTAPVRAQAQSSSAARPRTNILLITFDSLTAEDMSGYGYPHPTTPNMDAFAQSSAVFTNFYSSSTFTTCSLASVLTGLAPSETGVYHLWGHLRDQHAALTLPRILRDDGYATAAVIRNPMAYFLAANQNGDFEFLDGPVGSDRTTRKLWEWTGFLHPQRPFGSRSAEFFDLQNAWHFLRVRLSPLAPSLISASQARYSASETFATASELLKRLPQGHFLWIHLMDPHQPYLPSANLGRFLPSAEFRNAYEQATRFPNRTYPPDRQAEVDKLRLRYDECIADADQAFGEFITAFKQQPAWNDTVVIVSSDHGESHAAGALHHETPYQTRPEIHIPLMVHLPGRSQSARIDYVADQTALAPTILELAGLPRAPWMRGESLVPFLDPAAPAASAPERGLAFTEYFESDSVFNPLRSGTVGVTDGVHQYVYDLGSRAGVLRRESEPLVWNVDRSPEDPQAAADLKSALAARFPGLL